MARITCRNFEDTNNGIPTVLYTITNENGAAVTICSMGGIVTSLKVPDRQGKLRDVVLGYDHIKDYEGSGKYFGALIGRFANRIARGRFELNGKNYQLEVNNGMNHLHGGGVGFDRKVWDCKVLEDGLHLMLGSPDMEEHYPGNLKVEVVYQLDEENGLTIRYRAVCDQDTVINLTNHMYFNMEGHDGGSVTEQMMRIHASDFTPTDEGSIPTGEIRPVEGTVFDFREFKKIGEGIDDKGDQVQFAGGFDHNYIIDRKEEGMAMAAEAYGEDSGILMRCETTQKGIQFYTGNYIEEVMGKGGVKYQKRGGFCLETQNFPDAVNHMNFPDAVLKAGEVYEEVTRYGFGIR